MMKKNVVLIETINSTGTGILYPCKYSKKNKRNHVNYYIVFTNKHVLKDLEQNEVQKQNAKGLVDLQIYDDIGNKISEKDILEIIAFNPEWKFEKKEDVAALLVAIRDNIVITLETGIFRGDLTNRETIYMEGYPGILLGDEVSQKIQLQGIAKSVFPESNKIGIFQITDDYHWYNNLQDRELFRGMSGGPVYLEQEGKSVLLGMNQSVSVIKEGQNPFKLVYYLRMEYVLECLRLEGCILFRRIGGAKYEIEWIYETEKNVGIQINERDSQEKYEPLFLLVGGSGAGKSSFAKDFAYHGENLLATNDGQTTRTNVIYEYSIFCEKPKAEVTFMAQKEFCERMSELQGAAPAIKVLREIFGLSDDILKNDILLLENCYYFVENLKGRKNSATQLLEKMKECILENHRTGSVAAKTLIRTYEKLLELLIKSIPIPFVKYICDKKWIEKCRIQYQESYEKQYQVESELNRYWNEKITKILHEMDSMVLEDILEFGKILREYCEDNISYEEYQKECVAYIEKNKAYFEQKNELNSMQKLYELLEKFKKQYLKELFYVEGFFNVEEFRFLKHFKNLKEGVLTENEIELFPREKKEEIEVGRYEIHDIDIWEGTQSAYNEVFQRIKVAIQEEYGLSRSGEMKMEFYLPQMREQEKHQLRLCLQVSEGKSLTGVIRTVKIEDMVSNEYAMIFSELKIGKLKMADTYGLNHIEEQKSAENILYSHIYRLEEVEKVRKKDISVLYFKKLDAGRPDELRTVLPCVQRVVPQAPVYCVFTGIDIFYKTPKEVKSIQWKNAEDEKIPKSVRYILSERGRDDIMGKVAGGSTKKRNMYLVLKNNLVPYCGRKQMVQEEYEFYKNNERYIRRLLASIIMKEYSCLEIIDLRKIKDNEEAVRGEVEKIIVEIFKRASVSEVGTHWNTIRSNVTKISIDRRLGAWTSYRYQWNQRFHEAYTYVMEREGGNLAQKFEDSKEAIEAALINMEDSYLGTADNLSKIDLGEENEEKGNRFRELLKEMYKNGGLYVYNPFELSEEKRKQILSNSESRKAFFKDVFNFAKGIKNNKYFRDEFVKEFILRLNEQIASDNKVKVENMIHLNSSFAETLDNLKNEFIEKYKWNDEEVENVKEDFKEILKAYISTI